MKRIVLLLFIGLISFTGINAQTRKSQRIANTNTEEWRYDVICNGSGGSESSYLVLVSVYVTDQRLALEQARKSAIHAILFKGVVGNNMGCSQKNPLVSPQTEDEQADYFDDFFFDSSAYSQFATSPTGVPKEIIKLDDKGKTLRVDYVISVSIDNLRKRLENDNILKTLAVDESMQKPSIIIFPKKEFLIESGFYTIDQNGERVADYAEAMIDNDIRTAIANLEKLLQDRGFQPKNAGAEAESLKRNKVMDEVNTGRDGLDTQVTDLDKMLASAKADIRWEVDWKVNDNGLDRKLNYTVQAFDAYNNKAISTETGEGPSSFSASMPELLKQAITDKMDAFLGKHQSHFQDILDNGRPVVLEFKTFDMDSYAFDSEIEPGLTITDLIIEYVSAKSVSGNFSRQGTQSALTFEDVRIPLTIEIKSRFGDAKPISNTPFTFLTELKKYLMAEFQMDSQLLELGLGKARLTLGAK